MGQKRLESLRELIILRDKMGRYFEREEHAAPPLPGTWAPPVDLYETDETVVLLLEIPGVEEKDVRIELGENHITVQGQRRAHGGEESYLCVERNHGPFQRTFRLPTLVDDKDVRAEFRQGILKVSMKKQKGESPEYVRVKIS
ncbi:MAG: Hsp20/alpha crystallin family protein [Nitrospinae bacterium]|nr:Hsp20/alpha crystallin family protein [Nitrospinota bacterium]